MSSDRRYHSKDRRSYDSDRYGSRDRDVDRYSSRDRADRYRRSDERSHRSGYSDGHDDPVKQKRVPGHVELYETQVATVTRPAAYTSDKFASDRFTTGGKSSGRRLPVNPTFLSFLAGLVGFSLLVAAVVVVDWRVEVVTSPARANTIGLFQVCTRPASGEVTCQTIESFAERGSRITDLEQATRALVIIAVLVGVGATSVAFVLGLNTCQRRRGAFIVAGLYTFAGFIGVAAMGCYSAVLHDALQSTPTGTYVFTGGSFYLGWFGTGSLLLAAVTALIGHCAKRD